MESEGFKINTVLEKSVSWQTGAANLIIRLFPMSIFLSFRAPLQITVKVSDEPRKPSPSLRISYR